MSNQEKPEQKKDTENSGEISNIYETMIPLSGLDSERDLFSSLLVPAGTDGMQHHDANPNSDMPFGNCPACGFPRQREQPANPLIAPNLGICPECLNPLELSEKGYFVVYGDKNDHLDIAFQWIPAKDDRSKTTSPIPAEKHQLFKKIVTVNTVIKSLYFTADTDTDKDDQQRNHAIKKKYFKKLLSLSQAGLAGEMARPDLAATALERLKNEITTLEGQRIKNTYLKELGLSAFLSSLIALFIFFVTATGIFSATAALADLLFKKPDATALFQSGFLSVISMCSVIWIGAMIGTWVSFAARNPAFNFEQLSILETDRLKPTIRLIYIGICAIIFSLFLSSGIVALEIGTLSTASVANSISTQFIIGLLCGLTESKIGSFIYKKTEAVILNNQKDAAKPEETETDK